MKFDNKNVAGDNSAQEQDDTLNAGTAAGIAISALVIIITAVVILVIIIYKRKTHKKLKE